MVHKFFIDQLMDIADMAKDCSICKSIHNRVTSAVACKQFKAVNQELTIPYNFFNAEQNSHIEKIKVKGHMDLTDLIPFLE